MIEYLIFVETPDPFDTFFCASLRKHSGRAGVILIQIGGSSADVVVEMQN
jgi:hypothetical protein